MNRTFTVDDEGKAVVTAAGERVGTVHRIGENRAHVMPADDVGDRIRDRLGWVAAETQVYELTIDAVESITDEELRLSSEL